MSGSYRTELGETIGTPTAHLEPAPHRQQAGGAPQHVYDMLGLMPPGATLAFGQGSGPKGSTPLGIRYGGRGHWPEAAGDTGIPWDSCIAGPSGHWPTAASPTLPLSPWERSGQWDSPASAGLPCIRSAKPPRVGQTQE